MVVCEEVGIVVIFGDGIVYVEGFFLVMVNELLCFENGMMGIVFNLEEW